MCAPLAKAEFKSSKIKIPQPSLTIRPFLFLSNGRHKFGVRESNRLKPIKAVKENESTPPTIAT